MVAMFGYDNREETINTVILYAATPNPAKHLVSLPNVL